MDLRPVSYQALCTGIDCEIAVKRHHLADPFQAETNPGVEIPSLFDSMHSNYMLGDPIWKMRLVSLLLVGNN